MSNEQTVQGPVQAKKKMVVKGLLASFAAIATIGSANAAYAAYYVDYWGDDLFLGLAYHRFGCLSSESARVPSSTRVRAATATVLSKGP